MTARVFAFRHSAAVLALVVLGACSGEQSAFAPSGVEAARVNTLFWVMTIGGGLILAGVVAFTAFAIVGNARWRRVLSGECLILGGGLAFPVVTLSALLVYSYATQANPGGAIGPEQAMRVEIIGKQWWWRVRYHAPDGSTFESANELRIPVGEPVRLELKSADVLHSFWAPRLAGKLDMVPGRTNVLTITANEPGISRGQCAEYCGGAHAFMAFHVVALEPEAFATWHEAEAAPAGQPASRELAAGAQVFTDAGCGACHTIRGTAATGIIGPDLTHVGGRHSLAAATLPNDAEAIARWIRDNQHIKPGNKMPPFANLSEEDLALLAHYLDSLE